MAHYLDIPLKVLTYVLYVKHVENYYVSFCIPKSSGGTRRIDAPTGDLKAIQRKLALIIEKHIQKIHDENNINSNISHAFKKGKSIITNAQRHRNKHYVINVDLKDFFNSFHFGRIRGFFEKNKAFLLCHEVATIFAQLTCYNGCLPQGAPTSPIITNLICEILDIRLLKLAKDYKLDYTRYADDMTFSTNDKNILNRFNEFYSKLNFEIERAGFKINIEKTRFQYKDSRQTVTGLVVNKKISVDRRYCKKVRAMADHLYRHGTFNIDNRPGTLNQLEGMFSFINMIDYYNNELLYRQKKPKSTSLNSREKQYQKFLFYKNFFVNPKPLIITEGKTDVRYIKSALKNLYKDYPSLIEKIGLTYEFKVSFLNRTKTFSYLFGKSSGGADSFVDLAKTFLVKSKNDNLLEQFLSITHCRPCNPVILVFDNEISNPEKPLKKFTKNFSNFCSELNGKSLPDGCKYQLTKNGNLFLVTHQLVDGKEECEIEELFDDDTRKHIIGGKTLSLEKDAGKNNHYGKDTFSKYVEANYQKIDFSRFKPLLNYISDIVETYSSTLSNLEDKSLTE